MTAWPVTATRLIDGYHVGHGCGVLRWELDRVCRGLGMTPDRGIADLCHREGVGDLAELTAARGAELIGELKALGEDRPMSAQQRKMLAAVARRSDAAEKRRITEALAQDLAGDTYPL